MSIDLRGHILNQRQLDVITPVLNDYMHGKIKGQKKLEDAMVAALEQAGCPLGYDTSMPGAESTVHDRAVAWIRDGRVGLSSRAIHDHMLGLKAKEGWSHPWDPDDLNRCLLLLDLIPEWKPRMPEMAQRSKAWAGLVERWDEIVATFLEEVGLNWTKGKSAPRTYALMKQALGRDA